jgi:hypothetical protein
MSQWGLPAIVVMLIAYGAVSGRLCVHPCQPGHGVRRLGLLVGNRVLHLVEADMANQFVRYLAEATLALVLFTDAVRVNRSRLKHESGRTRTTARYRPALRHSGRHRGRAGPVPPADRSPWETADGTDWAPTAAPRTLASGAGWKAAAGWAARTLARLGRLSAHGRVEAMLSDSSEPQSGTWCALAPSFAGSATNTTYLESTLTMLKHKLETGVEVVRDYDRSLPELPARAVYGCSHRRRGRCDRRVVGGPPWNPRRCPYIGWILEQTEQSA